MAPEFGDILRYPDDQGVSDEILFMYLGQMRHGDTSYVRVAVLRTLADDDQWVPGDIVVAGINELIPYEKPSGTRILLDGTDVTDKVEWKALGGSAYQVTALDGKWLDGQITIVHD